MVRGMLTHKKSNRQLVKQKSKSNREASSQYISLKCTKYMSTFVQYCNNMKLNNIQDRNEIKNTFNYLNYIPLINKYVLSQSYFHLLNDTILSDGKI